MELGSGLPNLTDYQNFKQDDDDIERIQEEALSNAD